MVEEAPLKRSVLIKCATWNIGGCEGAESELEVSSTREKRMHSIKGTGFLGVNRSGRR